MRVGYVLKYFPKLSETFVLNEMVAMERAGAEVEVFALGPSDGVRFAPAISDLAAPVHYISLGGSAALFEGLIAQQDEVRQLGATHLEWLLAEVARGPKPETLLRRTVELALRVRAQRIEHLHAHFAGPAAELARLVGKLLDIPFSFTCHAKDIYHQSVDATAFQRLAADASTIITVCNANRRYIVERLAPQSAGKIHVLYNGVDLDLFNPRDRVPDTRSLVLGVGRLVAKKGFEYLVDAAVRLEDSGSQLNCLIAGEGREQESLQSRIDTSGAGSVRLIGPARHDEVRSLLTRASVLALPCVVDEAGNRDALPTVLLEALAAGVPVISTPVAGVTEIIDDGVNGLIVPERDVAALTGAIGRLLGEPATRERFSASGREKAEACFDVNSSASSLMTLLSGPAMPKAVA